MWIIRLALSRPYTFVVAALLLLLMTPFVITRTPTDIFPAINIPVVSVIWSFTGLPADQIAQRMVYPEERALTTTVNNIEQSDVVTAITSGRSTRVDRTIAAKMASPERGNGDKPIGVRDKSFACVVATARARSLS